MYFSKTAISASALTAATLGLLVCLAAMPLSAQGADSRGPAAKGGAASSAASGTSKPQAPKPKAAPGVRKAEKWDPERAQGEYQSLEIELALAKTEAPYLVFDTERRQLQFRLKGAVVWNCQVEIAPEDSGDLERFIAGFRGSDRRAVRLVSGRYLFEGAPQTPDSILAIVGQVVKADPSTLQRDLPERFQLFWGWRLVLDVRTTIAGIPKSRLKNNNLRVLEAIRRPFGEVMLEVRVPPEAALTIYRAASPGMPTLLQPYP